MAFISTAFFGCGVYTVDCVCKFVNMYHGYRNVYGFKHLFTVVSIAYSTSVLLHTKHCLLFICEYCESLSICLAIYLIVCCMYICVVVSHTMRGLQPYVNVPFRR